MIELRDYQREAIEQTSKAMQNGMKRPLIVAPTASGKSIIIAGMVAAILKKNPSKRVLILCHQGELLAQNQQKLWLMRVLNSGIYCAGQGSKVTEAQVILASRDSLGRNPSVCGNFDVAICDEAHMIPMDALSSDRTYYGKIFGTLKIPYVVGLTGTPWRLGGGFIYPTKDDEEDGEEIEIREAKEKQEAEKKEQVEKVEKFFEGCSYEIKMSNLIKRGYLSKYILPPKEVKTSIIETEGLETYKGDFRTSDLDDVSIPLVDNCLDLWLEHGSKRRVTLFFACSRAHGKVIAESLEKKYLKDPDKVAYLDSDTPTHLRQQILEEARAGKYKCIVNVAVLTTGVDIPIIDCICFMRATKSVSLFVQMAGRGLRVFDEKKDCLMLDLAANFEHFSSIEEPLSDMGAGENPYLKICKACEHENPGHLKYCQRCSRPLPEEEAKTKTCPECGDEHVPLAARVCPECGALFLSHGDEPVTETDLNVLWYNVNENHISKKGNICTQIKFTVSYTYGECETHYMYLHPNSEYVFLKKRASVFMERLKRSEPLKIKLEPKKKSKYRDIFVTKWSGA